MFFLSAQSDARVVGRVLAGQRDEYGVLVRRYLPTAHAAARARLCNPSDAEDAVQEAFIKAYERLDTLRDRGRFGSWLLAIVCNTCRNVNRGRARRAAAEQRDEPADRPTFPAPDREELHDMLRRQVEGLEESSREVLLLHYYAGRSAKEIAALLGLSHEAARKRLQRAREALSARMLQELRPAFEAPQPAEKRHSKIMAGVATVPVAWQATAASAATGGLAVAAKVVSALVVVGGLAATTAWLVPRAEPAPVPVAAAQQAAPETAAPAQTPEPPAVETSPAAPEAPAVADAQTLVPVTGRVYDGRTGKAIAGVELDAHPDGLHEQRYTAVTDAEGRYSLEAVAGETLSLMLKPDPRYCCAEPSERHVAVSSDPFEGADFTLLRTLTLEGRVIDETGKPVEGAEVRGSGRKYDRMEASAVSGAGGAYVLAGLPPDPDLHVTAYDNRGDMRFRRSSAAMNTLDSRGEPVGFLELRLRATGAMEGRVVDWSGRPADGVSVFPESVEGLEHTWYNASGEGQTDREGRFRLGGVLPGRYRMRAFAKNQPYEVEAVEPIEVTVGDVTRNVIVRLSASAEGEGRVQGFVRDARGNPLDQASVRVSGGERRVWKQTQTDANGRYVLEGLDPGEVYEMSAGHYLHTEAVKPGVSVGGGSVDFVLEGLGNVEGQVLSRQTGAPVAEFSVHTDAWRDWRNVLEVRDAEGRFKLTDVQGGERTLTVEAPGYAPTEQRVTIPPGERGTARVVVRLNPGLLVKGVVVDESGAPVSGADLHEEGRPDRLRARTGPDGRFNLAPLAGGPALTLEVAHPDYAPLTTRVAGQPGENLDLRLVLLKGGTIEGVVRVNGQPVAGASVEVGRRARRTSTDANGRYRLTAVAPSLPWPQLHVRPSPNGPMGRSFGVEVKPGETVTANVDFALGNSVCEGCVYLDGEPAFHASVYCFESGATGDDKTFYTLPTDDQGRFRLESLPAGRLTLHVSHDRCPDGVDVEVRTQPGRSTRCEVHLDSTPTEEASEAHEN